MLKQLDLNLIPDVILETDVKGITIDVNDSVYDMFGYLPEEVIGKPFDMLMPDRFRKNHARHFSNYQKKPISRRMGDLTESRFYGLDKNGHEFSIDISLSVVDNTENENTFVAIIRDISALVNLNSELNNSNDELKTKNKELEHMAYIISHDLKAPTRAVSQLIDIIEEDYIDTLNDETRNYFKLIKQRNGRMIDLIDGILSYSRAGNVNKDIEKLDFKEILNKTLLGLNIPQGFQVEFHSESFLLSVPETPFMQVLANLIGNALKYHDKSEGLVIVKAIKTIDEVEVRVIDDGPGIDEKYHSTIFEMFGTANEESRTDSTGIGLAIVKKIVKQNGGEIKLISTKGKGSEFIFTFKI